MTRVCPFLPVALLAIGCGDVVKDTSQVPTDGASDAPAVIKTVRVDTPASVNAQKISSSPLPLSAGNVAIAVTYWSDRTHQIAVSDSSGAMTWKSVERQSVAQGCAGGTNLQLFYATVPS